VAAGRSPALRGAAFAGRRVTRVSELTADDAAAEVGPLLHCSTAVVDELVEPEQVYTCLWSHAGGVPVHIHYVVLPVTLR
jgi:hypothetical protein